jgi:hypothetical protein
MLGLVVMLAAAARSAHSQPDSTAAIAEQLFDEGREHMREGRWAQACLKFEASRRIEPAIGAQLNLATCYERMGKLARAWGLYREVIDLAGKDDDVGRHDYAQSHAAALEPSLAMLTITVPTERPAGFTVRWDGSPIPPNALGIGLYADPGPHEILVVAPGFETVTKTVTLVEGKAETIAIPVLTATVPGYEPSTPASRDTTPDLAVASYRPPEPHAPTRPGDPSSPRPYLAIGLVTAGSATAGVGLWFGMKARSNSQQAKERCGEQLICNSTADFEAGKRLIRDARSDATISTLLVAAGGAVAVGGAIVFLVTTRTRDRANTEIVPVIDDHGAGFAVVGRL